MSTLINYEKKIIVLLAYTFALGFSLVGILLASVFNGAFFIDLNLKFLLISLLPLIVFYQIDSFYVKHGHNEKFILSHLAWITQSSIIYCLAFWIQCTWIKQLGDHLSLDLSVVTLLIFGWICLRLLFGINRAIGQKNAPPCLHLFPLVRKLFGYFKK